MERVSLAEGRNQTEAMTRDTSASPGALPARENESPLEHSRRRRANGRQQLEDMEDCRTGNAQLSSKSGPRWLPRQAPVKEWPPARRQEWVAMHRGGCDAFASVAPERVVDDEPKDTGGCQAYDE